MAFLGIIQTEHYTDGHVVTCTPASKSFVVVESKIRLVLDFSLVRRCHSLRQLASSTRTRRVKNTYKRQFHVPVQPLASEPSQAVVRIHHLDRDRVIIANQIITQSHPTLSEACNAFLILDPLCPRSAVGHQFLIQSASESWAQQTEFSSIVQR